AREVVAKFGSLGKAVVRHGRIADGRGDHASFESRQILELARDLAIVAGWWQRRRERVAGSKLNQNPESAPHQCKVYRCTTRREQPVSCIVSGGKAKRTAQRIANDITNTGVTSVNRQVLRDFDTCREE